MTLIIGFVCQEGIALVSDTKITNAETLEANYASKILTPLKNTPFIVGAAGYTDLFNEFNRKIWEQVEQQIRRYKIANIEQLIRTGLERHEAIARVEKLQKSITNDQQMLAEKPELITKDVIQDIELPYVYSPENFLDDCKSLIKTITEDSGFSNPLEVLIGIRSDYYASPILYKIDSRGREEMVRDFTAIGSGTPYVKMFFGRKYDLNKTYAELAKEAIRAITFAQDIAKENSVGFSDEKLPEVVIVDNAYNYGRVNFTNIRDVLSEIKEEFTRFEDIILNTKIKNLEES